MSFAAGGLYKLFETPDTQIQRFIQGPGLGNTPSQTPNSGVIDLTCNKCNNKLKLQANFEPAVPMQEGTIPFPVNDKLVCPSCKFEHSVGKIREQLESQFGKKII